MKCIVCGDTFQGQRNAKSCSPPCIAENRRRRRRRKAKLYRDSHPPVIAVCVICGDEYRQMGIAKTCGKECSLALLRARDTRMRKEYQARRREKLRQGIAAKLGKAQRPKLSDYPPGTRGVWNCEGGVITRVC